MICRQCKHEMTLEFVGDTGSNGFVFPDGRNTGGVAYNVYECDACMIIARENVWECPGVVWVLPDNSTVFEPPSAE